MAHDKTRVSLYVLNDYLKFDRKIYQLFGVSLGRPIKLKTILYFLIFGVAEIIIYFTPFIGGILKWFPDIFLLIIPGLLAYLFSDIRTEGRLPVAFFRSIIVYLFRKMKKVTYSRGREIKKLTTYRFEGYSTITFAEDRTEDNFVPKKIKFKKKNMPRATLFLDRAKNRKGELV